MAYIPPHKRHDRSAPIPSPYPDSLIPGFKGKLNLGPPSHRRGFRPGAGKSIVYAEGSIFRWWPVGSSSNGDPIPSSFRLEPSDCETLEQRDGRKPLVLVASRDSESEEDATQVQDITPWVSIAERVVPDLITAALGVRNELKLDEDGMTKLCFIAKPGKIFFHGSTSLSLDSIRKAVSIQVNPGNKLRKTFYTNVPSAYMENLKTSVVPKIGFAFKCEKEYYHVKVSDKLRPDSIFSFKCTVTESGLLEIRKIEGNLVRYLVEDISFLYKKLDMRLILVTKRIMKIIDNEESNSMKELVRSAIIDPAMKGGLRWPLGKDSAADRFRVVGVWHTKCIAFDSNTIGLRLLHADRFDRLTSTGEVTTEVSLKLAEITRYLKEEEDTETSMLKEMVEEALKLFWNHFLI